MTGKKELTHLDEQGNARMVDVGAKRVTRRKALAQAVVRLAPATLALLKAGGLPKGDALACAKIGGILAAKKTAELIPLCHPLPLEFVDVRFEIMDDLAQIRVLAEAACEGKTGVEMEALIAAQNAAAIIYDMCKAVQKDIVINDVRLLYKTGGKSGEYRAPDYRE